jgi:hypothetical protein
VSADVNRNAPTKAMVIEFAAKEGATVFVAFEGAVKARAPLVARGRCPGRGCGKSVAFEHPELLAKLARTLDTPGLARGKLGDSTCPACGQHVDLHARLVRVA